MIADGQRLEHVLRIITGVGLRNLKGKTVNKQTFSKMMRNKVYTGEITSGGITARGTFEPLIPEDIFQRAQDVLAGRVRKREHKPKTDVFPLRGFVMCPSCKSKLTAGMVRGRNGSKVGYYFCWQKGCRAVSVRKEILERDWVVVLNMMQPDNSYWKQLADSASTRWHLEEEEEKRFKKELEAQNAKYVRAIDAKISGEITAADFELWKASVAKEVERLEDAIKSIEAKRQVTEQLMDAPEIKESFADRWLKTSDLDDKQAFQRGLFSDGIFWSHSSAFFETGNRSLFQAVEEMLSEMVVGANGFEPSTSWSRTKPNSIDSVSLNTILLALLKVKLDPRVDPRKIGAGRDAAAFPTFP
jgi:hypothetical protein